MSATRKHPRISVVVPSFKSRATLHSCIESVLSQTFSSVEAVIAPDDGDDHADMIALYPKDQVVFIPPNPIQRTGPAATRNRAIAAARGDYLIALDADDTMAPGHLDALIGPAEAAGMAVGAVEYVTSCGRVVRRPRLPPRGRMAVDDLAISLSSIRPLYHRSLEVGYFDGFAEDILHDAILLSGSQAICVPDSPPMRITLHGTSICASASERVVRDSYSLWSSLLLDQPSRIGAAGIGCSDRVAIARLFAFRSWVSERVFSGAVSNDAPGSRYHLGVAGRELGLWQAFLYGESSVPQVY